MKRMSCFHKNSNSNNLISNSNIVTSTEVERSVKHRFLGYARNDIAILMIIIITLFTGCSEFNAVKSPSVEITQSDVSSDQCTIVLTAGRYGIIRWTTDGTVPVYASEIYESPLTLPAGTTLRTASFCPGGRRSEIVTVTVEPPSSKESAVIITNSEYCPAPPNSETSK
ncbi:MAG: chitobiase/beta-hexosaminidase C-terminal domain-containing protein [Spirochaetales bacterium]|nr:chitobiase/beta-hexosaminidase C-terminal domain-containing protein [Spirochaetales bacterium]